MVPKLQTQIRYAPAHEHIMRSQTSLIKIYKKKNIILRKKMCLENVFQYAFRTMN